MEEFDDGGAPHIHARGQTPPRRISPAGRGHEKGRLSQLSCGHQEDDARPEAAPHLGRTAGASGETRHGLDQKRKSVAQGRAISGLRPRAFSRRISLVAHQNEGSRPRAAEGACGFDAQGAQGVPPDQTQSAHSHGMPQESRYINLSVKSQ